MILLNLEHSIPGYIEKQFRIFYWDLRRLLLGTLGNSRDMHPNIDNILGCRLDKYMARYNWHKDRGIYNRDDQ